MENLLQTYPKVDAYWRRMTRWPSARSMRWTERTKSAGLSVSMPARRRLEPIKQGNCSLAATIPGLNKGVSVVMAAVRALRKQPVPRTSLAETEVVTSANYQSYDVAPDKLTCPTWPTPSGSEAEHRPLYFRSKDMHWIIYCNDKPDPGAS